MKFQKMVLTMAEVCGALGLSRTTGYKLAREGKLPTVRLGHKLFVSREGLSRLLNPSGQGGDRPIDGGNATSGYVPLFADFEGTKRG